MRKKLLLLTPLFFTALFIADGLQQNAHTYTAGAPKGNTGSPGDGTNCAKSCHQGGTPPAQAGWITSDIPANGWSPGETYTITATATDASSSKFGFQISPQDAGGNLVGTLIATNTTTTQLIDGGKYITHKSAGTSGSGSKTWTFEWTAPSSGSSVTFYGAFNASNSNSHQSGDNIYTSTLTAENGGGVSIEDLSSAISSFTVYPNPVAEYVGISYHLKNAAAVSMNLYNMEGQKVAELLNTYESAGAQQHKIFLEQDYPAGVYFLEVKTDEFSQVKKLMIQ